VIRESTPSVENLDFDSTNCLLNTSQPLVKSPFYLYQKQNLSLSLIINI